MSVSILDCTLRDGGYINNWSFSSKAVTEIIHGLFIADIDIIEVGFLDDKKGSDEGTLFDSVNTADKYISSSNINRTSNCVAMIMHGQFDCEKLPECKDTLLSGIRYCFKKNCINDALEHCKTIKQKGYDVYLQPAALSDYNDYEILDLVAEANKVDICAFYIVDTFGVMRKNDVIRYFYLIDENLKDNVAIGYHSHNNLQLSFSNSQELISLNPKREIIIDSSVFGMGRGAGNLCTELITRYINENIADKYDIMPILEIMDEYIMPVYRQHPWGYSAPYYIAAINDCHPNYATFLMNKETLCIRDINSIIKSIPEESKHIYSEVLIGRMYFDYQEKSIDDSSVIRQLSELCSKREVLILAPGKSLVTKEKVISDFIKQNDPVIFAINHIPEKYSYDKVFISNLKRFKCIDDAENRLGDKLICTSNIAVSKTGRAVNYSAYLNDDETISDNAGLMIINVLKKAGVKKVNLAGYDGFSYSEQNNYCDERLISNVRYERQTELNMSMKKYFKNIRRSMEICFITPTIYDSGEKDEKV